MEQLFKKLLYMKVVRNEIAPGVFASNVGLFTGCCNKQLCNLNKEEIHFLIKIGVKFLREDEKK